VRNCHGENVIEDIQSDEEEPLHKKTRDEDEFFGFGGGDIQKTVDRCGQMSRAIARAIEEISDEGEDNVDEDNADNGHDDNDEDDEDNGHDDANVIQTDEPLVLNPRQEWNWEENPEHHHGKTDPIFPEPNYTQYKDMTPRMLFDVFFDGDIIDKIVAKSNEYGMAKFGNVPNITSEDLLSFFGILLLSGYNSVKELELFWSNSEDVQNLMVKKAMPRDKFRLVKCCFHLGDANENRAGDGQEWDWYGKVRLLLKHLQTKFMENFVPEQNLSHDESMIKYFGKSGLKQSIRNKPIRFGFKAWCLATVSGYVPTFDLYQGKGIGTHHQDNVAAIGAAGASLLDLIDQFSPEKKVLPYHFYGDNFFSSMKLLDVMGMNNYNYTGTMRKDRLKGNPPITAVEQFKKKERGHHECVALEDKTQFITR
jgi:hypothetical protein